MSEITLTIIDAEHVRTPDGSVFRGVNCETDAARALIGAGEAPDAVLAAVWHDGRRSYQTRLECLARKRFSDEHGTSRWRPHPKAVLPPLLAAWWEAEQARHAAKRQALAA